MVKSLSSVSIQTVPVMGAGAGAGAGAGHFANGEISTISRVVNGGTRLQVQTLDRSLISIEC